MRAPVNIAEAKKLCACIPFVNDDAGQPETEAMMRSLIGEVEALRADVEICMEVLDKLAYPTTIGPAIMGNLGEAADNEIRMRAELADRERKRTWTWKYAESQMPHEEPPHDR